MSKGAQRSIDQGTRETVRGKGHRRTRAERDRWMEDTKREREETDGRGKR